MRDVLDYKIFEENLLIETVVFEMSAAIRINVEERSVSPPIAHNDSRDCDLARVPQILGTQGHMMLD